MINKKIISAITSLCMALSCMSFSVSVSAGKSSEVLMRPESSISNGASYVDSSITEITYTFDEALAECDAGAVVLSEISGNKSDDDIIIADYSRPDSKLPSNKGGNTNISLTDEVSFMGKGRTSLKWTVTEAGSANDWFTTELVSAGFKSVAGSYPDSIVCIRYYSPEASGGFGFTSAPKLDIRASQGAYTTTAMFSGGWQIASVKASDLIASFAKWKNYAGSDIVVKFDAATGSAGLINGTEIYIDRVWLDKNTATEEASDALYSVSCAGNELKLEFNSTLDRAAYKIELMSNKIKSESGKSMKENQVFYFSVGCDVPYTVPVSVSPKDGSVNVNARENGFEYTVEFNNDVSANMAGNVAICKADEIYYDYSLIADGKALTFKFGEPLEGDFIYTISISPDFTGENGVCIDAGYEFSFRTIEDLFSPRFKVIETTPANGSVVDDASELQIRFNNSLDASLRYPDFISVYEDGAKLHNFYTASVDDKILTLEFTRKLNPGKQYCVKISDSFRDMFGNLICDNEVISFSKTAAPEYEYCVIPLFSSEIADNMKTPLSDDYGWTSETAELGGKNEKALRIDWKSGETHAVVINGKATDIGNAKYINYYMYSPKSYGEYVNLVCYKQPSGYGVYNYSLDFTGWKLITLPLSDIFGDSLPENISSVQISFGGWGVTWEEDGYLGVEKIWLSDSKPVAPVLTSATYPDEYPNAGISGERIDFVFNTALKSGTLPDITVTDMEGNAFKDYEACIHNEILALKFGTLTPGMEYTVTIDNIVSYQDIASIGSVIYTFSAASDGSYIKSMSLSPELLSGGKCTAHFEIGNLSDAAEKVKLCVVAYDEDSRTLSEEISDITLSGNCELSENVTLSLNEKTAYVKAFVLLADNRILGDEYVLLNESGAKNLTGDETRGNKPELDIKDVNLSDDVLCVRAKASALCTTVLVKMKTPGGDEFFEPITVSAAGDAEYYYVFDKSASGGNYRITLSSRGNSDTASVYYISSAHREAILLSANSKDSKPLSELFCSNAEFFGKDISDDMLGDAARHVLNSAPYDSFGDVIKEAVGYIEVVTDINSSAWNTLAGKLAEYGEMLFKESEAKNDFEYFVSCKSGIQNTICKYIVEDLPAQTAEELSQYLADAIDEYRDSEKKPTGGSPGSGGSGGSPKKTTSSSYASADTVVNPYTPVEIPVIFDDLDGAPWARESILSLHKKGIVSSSDNKKFRPDDNITREEFVKLLVCAFASDVSGAYHAFTDSESGSWYVAYLSKSWNAGITTGYPDGSFGVGESITREDMVTMCARTLELSGVTVSSDEESVFADSEFISDYAKGYVSFFASSGIINGMGDGTFSPKATATRAQAAKIINGLINFY